MVVIFRSEYGNEPGFLINIETDDYFEHIDSLMVNVVDEDVGLVVPSDSNYDFKSSNQTLWI